MEGREDIEHSISHSGRKAVVAVARSATLGIDVERVAATPDVMGLADVVLSAAERRVFQNVPQEARPAALSRYWTRKEAVLKATGHGLAVPPSAVVVTPPDAPAGLVSWTADGPPPMPVELHDVSSGDAHVACLAVLGRRLSVVELDAAGILG